MSERVAFHLPGVHTDVTREDFNQHMRTIVGEINKLNASIASLRQNPQFAGDIDMQGYRVTNVGRTQKRSDVPSREELEDKALFENAGGQHVARSSIIATDGIRSKRHAREGDELITLQQARELGSVSGVTIDTDQFVTGFKLFTRIGFGHSAIACINGDNNHNITLGDNAPSVMLITGPTGTFGLSSFSDSSGVSGPNVDGRLLIIINLTGFNMRILNDTHFLGLPANRIRTLSGSASVSDITSSGDCAVIFVYQTIINRWVVVSFWQ